MKRFSLILMLILLVSIMATSCSVTEAIKCWANPNESDDQSADDNNNDSTTEVPDDGREFVLTGIVNSVSDRIEIEVINSDYAFGIYWVLISDSTTIQRADGSKISLSNIKVGDTVEITYGGQVMMSYPPQIAARKVTLR